MSVTLVSMEELPVIALTYEVYKKLLVLTATLDRQYRYSLGEQTVASCRDILRELILAKHAPKPLKINHLNAATASAELTAIQLRAILELNLANETNCLKIQAKLRETRRMLGGWRKSLLWTPILTARRALFSFLTLFLSAFELPSELTLTFGT